jgi:hypothetical protein
MKTGVSLDLSLKNIQSIIFKSLNFQIANELYLLALIH